MMSKRFRVTLLGGAGAAGQAIASQLRKDDSLQLTITSRSRERCEKAARRFGWDELDSNRRVIPRIVNAADRASLEKVLTACDVVIVCMPYNGLARTVIEATVRANCHYIDINADRDKHEVLVELEQTVSHSGRTFITEAGLIPGCPLVLAKIILSKLPIADSLRIGSLYRDSSLAFGSARDIMSEIRETSYVLRDGKWMETSAMDFERVNFGEPYGKRLTVPADIPEMRPLANSGELHAIAVRQTGMNPIANLVAVGWSLLPQKLAEDAAIQAAKLYQLACRWFTGQPLGVVLIAEAYIAGQSESQSAKIRISHDSVYAATAIPVAVAVKYLKQGRCPKGVHFLGEAVPVSDFLTDMTSRGISVSY